MKLPLTTRECGPLLELGWISRQLHLGTPTGEGVATIPVARIVGSVHRARDFDACWNPMTPRLAKLIADIHSAQPPAMDEPIEVVRVDRAYFVRDGHKRVSLAKHTGREFIDADVHRAASPFAFTDPVDEQDVLRTARELEFRRHSGVAEALPDVRFALTDMDAYGELYAAVRNHAFRMAEDAGGQVQPWPDVARSWYESDYQPTVRRARESIGGLVDGCSDADIYMAIHRQRLAWWGTECDDPEEAAQQLLVQQKLADARRGLRAVIGRAPPARPATLLPLTNRDD